MRRCDGSSSVILGTIEVEAQKLLLYLVESGN